MTGRYTERESQILAVNAVFAAIATIVLALRFLSRRVQGAGLSSADWVMLAAWPFMFGFFVVDTVGVIYGGFGRHQWELNFDQIRTWLKAVFALQMLWAASLGLIKTSICLFYIQLFPPRKFRIISYIAIGVCNAFAVAVILGTVLICMPVESSYEPTIPSTCGNRVGMWVAIGTFNITTDLLVVFLPLPVLWGLNMPFKRRLGLCIVFSLGTFVCVISGIRLKYLLDVDFDGDASYQIGLASIWSFLEPALAMTVGCIPTLRPLFLSLTGRKLESSRTTPRRDYRQRTYGSSESSAWMDDKPSAVPLTNVTAVTTPGDNWSYDYSQESEQPEALHARDYCRRGIKMTQQWEVKRTSL